MPPVHERLHAYLRETTVLESCRSILGWDQETYMPRGAAELRADQLAHLAGLVHRRASAPGLGNLIAEAEDAGGAELLVANVREARRDYDRATRVPAELVEEQARVTTLARRQWAEARAARDFGRFLPWFERVVDICRRLADAWGYEDHPYDALLETYEPDARTAELERLFAPLRAAHADLVARILDRGSPVDDTFLAGPFPVERQQEFARRVAEAVGFDFERGRIDLAVHPMCAGQGPFDVRITTRYREDSLCDGLFSVLHEVGHGLYSQGLDPGEFGRPTGEPCSLGIHESQSRLWENMVGRSRGFWQHFYADAQALFPEVLGDVDLDRFWRAINRVQPSFIRVDADEVTYNLHIFLRFEIEQALIAGELAPRDVPEVWNENFERDLRLHPAHDADGCLQDIHWSAGLLGYFPTYTLGNAYAAQFRDRAEADLGDLEEQFARGEFEPLLGWLREKVHRHGRRYPATQLVQQVTGVPPSPAPLMANLESKYARVYGL